MSDGYNNSRVAKFDKDGVFITSWGSYGTEPGQFNTLHTIATDADGNVYVGDRSNDRIQVFDNDGNFKQAITGIGAPWGICISPGTPQYFSVFTDLSTAVERSGSAPGLGPSEWDEQWPTSVSGAASVRRACRVLAEGPI